MIDEKIEKTIYRGLATLFETAQNGGSEWDRSCAISAIYDIARKVAEETVLILKHDARHPERHCAVLELEKYRRLIASSKEA